MDEHSLSSQFQGSDTETVRVAKCPNCEAPIEAPYCGNCGQLQKNINRQIWSLTGDLLDDIFRIDSRITITMFALFFRPGFLTTEYFDGRRARYTPPLRLYLVISFLFFFLVPTITEYSADIQNADNQNKDSDIIVIQADPEEDEVNVDLPWLTPEENVAYSGRLQEQVNKARDLINEDPANAFGMLMDMMSGVMFFMLPIFAIFLKLMYIGSGVYYAEHLLLAVHNHCFMFAALLISAVLDLTKSMAVGLVTEPLNDALMIWIAVYMFLSLKTTFGQSLLKTTFKFFILAWVYFSLTIIGILTASFIGLMSL